MLTLAWNSAAEPGRRRQSCPGQPEPADLTGDDFAGHPRLDGEHGHAIPSPPYTSDLPAVRGARCELCSAARKALWPLRLAGSTFSPAILLFDSCQDDPAFAGRHVAPVSRASQPLRPLVGAMTTSVKKRYETLLRALRPLVGAMTTCRRGGAGSGPAVRVATSRRGDDDQRRHGRVPRLRVATPRRGDDDSVVATMAADVVGVATPRRGDDDEAYFYAW